MKAAVPGEIVDARRCLEKNDWRTRWDRFAPRNSSRHGCNFFIIEPADQSTFDALGEELFQQFSFNVSLRGEE